MYEQRARNQEPHEGQTGLAVAGLSLPLLWLHHALPADDFPYAAILLLLDEPQSASNTSLNIWVFVSKQHSHNLLINSTHPCSSALLHLAASGSSYFFGRLYNTENDTEEISTHPCNSALQRLAASGSANSTTAVPLDLPLARSSTNLQDSRGPNTAAADSTVASVVHQCRLLM
jgi:hypothetical protein